jgi:2-alkyl-3-oxoalkanoate reductase
MRVLVTGAAGFIGGHVVEVLSARGHAVRALVRARVDRPWLASAEQVEGDITRNESLHAAVQDCDGVVHCAAVADFGVTSDTWHSVNVRGTEHVVAAARAAGVGRLVHLSTFLVHEPREGVCIDENGPIAAHPPAGYVASKVAADALVRSAASDLSVVVLRPGVVYGPRDGAALPRIVALLSSGRFWFVAGGRFHAHVVYVENLVDAVVASIERTAAAGAYLVIDHPPVEVREFIWEIADGLGMPRPARSVPRFIAVAAERARQKLPRALRGETLLRRYGMQVFTRDLRFSTERAQRELGFCSRIPYAEGMGRLVAWARRDWLPTRSPSART